jgi:hypothetical protein
MIPAQLAMNRIEMIGAWSWHWHVVVPLRGVGFSRIIILVKNEIAGYFAPCFAALDKLLTLGN